MSDSAHAFYAPSSLKYRRICPGWKNSNAGDSVHSLEGTELHERMETGSLEGLTEEQVQAVKACFAFVQPLEENADRVFKELRLNIMSGTTFGTADRVILKNKHADVVDWKFGRGHIDDAENNLQGISYAIGVFEVFDVESVTVSFVIPRRDELSQHTFTREELPALRTQVKRVIGLCELWEKSGDESLLNPCDIACQYCGRLEDGECAKHNQTALSIAAKYEPLEVIDETHSSKITDPSQMAKAFAVARIMEKWVGSVKKHALEMASQGFELPGFELRERSGSRSIDNPVLAYDVLIEAGLDPIEITSAAKLSLSALEKLVSDKAPRGKKKKAVAELSASLANAECINYGSPTVYLRKTSG